MPVTLEGALPEGINHNCIWLPDSRMGGFFEGTILTLSKTAQGSGLLREAVNCIQATAKFICGSVQFLSLQPASPAATVAKQACRKASQPDAWAAFPLYLSAWNRKADRDPS